MTYVEIKRRINNDKFLKGCGLDDLICFRFLSSKSCIHEINAGPKIPQTFALSLSNNKVQIMFRNAASSILIRHEGRRSREGSCVFNSAPLHKESRPKMAKVKLGLLTSDLPNLASSRSSSLEPFRFWSLELCRSWTLQLASSSTLSAISVSRSSFSSKRHERCTRCRARPCRDISRQEFLPWRRPVPRFASSLRPANWEIPAVRFCAITYVICRIIGRH